MNKIEKLKNLFTEATSLNDFSWLSEIQYQSAKFILGKEGRFAPKNNIIDIYTVRRSINESRGKPIKGFNSLLNNLNSTKSEDVCIHKMKIDENFIYFIFTTPEIDELFGILKIPENLSNKSHT